MVDFVFFVPPVSLESLISEILYDDCSFLIQQIQHLRRIVGRLHLIERLYDHTVFIDQICRPHNAHGNLFRKEEKPYTRPASAGTVYGSA